MQKRRRAVKNLVALVLLAGCAAQTGGPDALDLAYRQSIADSAVKHPAYVRPLQPIDASLLSVKLVHIQPYPTIDASRFTWVTHPEELRAFCHGKPDPLLAMQMALGLPPEKRDDVKVFTFETKPANIFRPCASSPDITTNQCSVDLPVPVVAAKDATEHFVLKQIMDSYRADFKYPGYPFTAMGWSYDWDPASPTHQGVSEYVVKPGAVISNVSSVDPATFCGAS